MSGKTVELDSLQEAFKALDYYISDLQLKVTKIRKYAKECSDLMDNDTYSQRAFLVLKDGLAKISTAVSKANDVKEKIAKKIHEIEESERVLN